MFKCYIQKGYQTQVTNLPRLLMARVVTDLQEGCNSVYAYLTISMVQ